MRTIRKNWRFLSDLRRTFLLAILLGWSASVAAVHEIVAEHGDAAEICAVCHIGSSDDVSVASAAAVDTRPLVAVVQPKPDTARVGIALPGRKARAPPVTA